MKICLYVHITTLCELVLLGYIYGNSASCIIYKRASSPNIQTSNHSSNELSMVVTTGNGTNSMYNAQTDSILQF